MNRDAVQVQPVVRLKAASLGAVGEDWLRSLPALVADLERQWSITVDRSMSGGTAAYVAAARTRDGQQVVLKVVVPGPDLDDEIGTLARAQGRGYVLLLAHDTARHAMLLEALGPALSRSEMPPEKQLETLCRLLAQAWSVRSGTGESATPQDKASGLERMVTRLWDELDRPCPERVADQALLFASRRAAAFDPDRCVVVHGDAAAANALQVLEPRPGAETGFVFVDPDGFVGDPAYDLGVALRDWCRQLLASREPLTLARRYCRLLAEGSGMDEQAVWEWGFLERVSTGLYAQAFGAHELGRPFLETADLLC